MGIFKTKYIRNGIELTGYKIYCGVNSDGKEIVKRAKTLRRAQEIDAHYRSAREGLDRELLALPLSAKVEAVAIIGKCVANQTTLTEIYNYWAKAKIRSGSKTVNECASKFIESMETSGRRDTYKQTMSLFLKKLCDKIGYLNVPAVRLEDLEKCQEKVPLKSRTTWRSRACSFFSFCVRKGYAQENVAERLDTPSVQREIPHILTVSQCKKLLAECPTKNLAGLILMLFAGIRPAEAKQMAWPSISLEDRVITITADIAKTRAFRKISIPDNVSAWLSYAKEHVRVLEILLYDFVR